MHGRTSRLGRGTGGALNTRGITRAIAYWFHAHSFRTHQNSCLWKAQYQRDKNFEVKLEEQTLPGKHYLYLIC
jgi:hypothetical protein